MPGRKPFNKRLALCSKRQVDSKCKITHAISLAKSNPTQDVPSELYNPCVGYIDSVSIFGRPSAVWRANGPICYYNTQPDNGCAGTFAAGYRLCPCS
eukprot:90349-Chlamydomonas_euryale.AAC.1